jgi:hypothetical protein
MSLAQLATARERALGDLGIDPTGFTAAAHRLAPGTSSPDSPD